MELYVNGDLYAITDRTEAAGVADMIAEARGEFDLADYEVAALRDRWVICIAPIHPFDEYSVIAIDAGSDPWRAYPRSMAK